MTFTIQVQDFYFKKWDRVRSGTYGQSSYVIGVKKKNGNVTLKLFPHEEQETRFAQFVWFRLLKMLVFLKLI